MDANKMISLRRLDLVGSGKSPDTAAVMLVMSDTKLDFDPGLASFSLTKRNIICSYSGLHPSQGSTAVISRLLLEMDFSNYLFVNIEVHSEIRSHRHYCNADTKPSTTRIVDSTFCDPF